jgi:hypothetical protein
MGRMRGIIEEPTGLRYVTPLLSEDQGRDLLERVRGLEFDELRMQAAKYCHGSARSNSDRPTTLAKSADVAKRGRPSVRRTRNGTLSAGVPIADRLVRMAVRCRRRNG